MTMLFHLSNYLQQFWGPFRLLGSHILLLAGGAFFAAMAVVYFLPRCWHRLPKDRGKALCGKDGMQSAGKPTGAGLQVTLFTLPIILLFVPLGFWDFGALAAIYAAMVFGYLDDAAKVPWGRTKKGLLDAVCTLAVAFFIAKGHGTLVWLPFVKGMWMVPLWAYVPLGGFLLWVTLNATNCSDGVDGLAGSLTGITLVMLAIMLYIVIGYKPVANYFLIPCNPEAAKWAILSMTVAGGFGGYLWYNAQPSLVLMGDAGSRFLGILVGALVLVTGNPILIIALSPIVLVNGGGGLVKIAILRIAKKVGFDIGEDTAIRKVRFPLHDHCKVKLGWSNAQVLMRFILLQLVGMPILLLILIKVR